MSNSDVIIIGGGMAGVSLAAEIAKQFSVVLLETEPMPGYHATGRSAAVYVPNYGDGPVLELTRMSRAQFDNADPEYWHSPLLSHRGLLRLVRADGDADYRKQMGSDEGLEHISVSEAQSFFPLLNPERFINASYEDNVHDIDVDAMLQGYLRKARKLGATIATKSGATEITRQAGIWTVKAGGENYSAPVVVNAAGAWADCVAKMAGVAPLRLTPCRRSMAVLPLPDALAAVDHVPFVVPFPFGWYAKAEAGRLLVSAAEEDPVEPCDAYADDMALAEGLDRFAQDTTIEVERVESSWAGLRTFSPDGYHVLGFDAEADGFFWLAGQGGFGIQTAPAVAALGASLLLGDGKFPVLAKALGPCRFLT